MDALIMAIDQGTTGSTVLLINRRLEVVARATREFPQIFPQPGWVSHNPEDIWHSVRQSVSSVMTQAGQPSIAAIGITNQRETTVLWDRRTGEPLTDAIVWQCRRTEPLCRALKERGLEPLFRARTGLVLDPYFSGTKIRWILDNVPGARERAARGEVAFGTIDTYLTWRLTGGAAHVTDVSNASRTLLMNLETLDWDDELLELLDIPRSILPEIRGSSEVYGTTRVPGLPDGVPVAGMAGDQQAALFGQLCFEPGSAKCTYGTGAFLLMNTGSIPVRSENGLLTTVGWRIGREVTYALEGSAFIAGAAVQWLRDGLKVIRSAAEIEPLAREVEDSGGLVFVPALAGLGAPHWRPEARGLIHGIDRGTTLAHLARAVLEGIALQNLDLLNAMEQDLKQPLTGLRVDGGAAANDLLMQFQADVLGKEIVRPKMLETTALGAALLAGLGVGMWSGLDDLKSAWAVDRVFAPSMPADRVAAHVARWRDAVRKA
jgi:glycerol kinase